MAPAAAILRKIGKVIAYFVVGVTGVVAFVLVSLYYVLQSDWAMRQILNAALPPVEQAICAKIEIQKFYLRLLPFRLELSGVTYTDPGGKYERPFARLGRLLVTAQTLPLLLGKVVVNEVRVEGAENYLYIGDNGLENLPICPWPPKPKKPPGPVFRLKLPILVKKVTVDARFGMDIPSTTKPATPEEPNPKPAAPLRLTVDAVHVDARANLSSGDAWANVRIGDGNFRLGNLAEQIRELRIDAKANLQQWDAVVPRIDISLADLTLHGTAQAKDLLEELEASAHLDIASDLHNANRLVLQAPTDPQFEGPFSISVDGGVRVGDDRLTYWGNGNLDVAAATVNQLAIRNMHTEFSVDQDQADVTTLHLETAGGAADVRAHLTLADELPAHAEIRLSNLNGAEAMAKYGLKDLGARGVVGGNLSANGTLSPFKLGARGQLRIASAGYRDVVRAAATTIDFDAVTEGAKNDIRRLSVVVNDVGADIGEIPTATITFQGQVSPTINRIAALTVATPHTSIQAHGAANFDGRVDLQTTADFDDLAEFTTFAHKPLGGRGRLTAAVQGALKNPTIDGRLDFADLRYDQVNVKSIQADLRLENRRAAANNVVVQLPQTTLRASATYDMKEKDPVIEAKASLPETDVADLLRTAGLGDKTPAGGQVELAVDVRGPLKKLSGTAALKGRDLSAYDETVKQLDLDATLQDGTIVFKDFSIVKERGIRPSVEQNIWRNRPEREATPAEQEPARLTVTGRVNPFEKSFDVHLRSTNLTEMASNIVVKNHIEAMADVGLNADLSGTFANPAGRLNLDIDHGRYRHMDLGHSRIDVAIQNEKVVVAGELLAGRRPLAPQLPPALRAPLPPKTKADRAAVSPADDDAVDPDFQPAAPPNEPAPPARPLGSIKIDATLELTGARRFAGQIVFDKFDYADFLKTPARERRLTKTRRRGPTTSGAPSNPNDNLYGMIDGNAAFSGALAEETAGAEGGKTRLRDVVAAVHFDELLFQQDKFKIRNQDAQGRLTPVEIRYAKGVLSVPSFALGGENVHLSLTNKTIDGADYLELAGDVDLRIAMALTPALADASGKLALRAQLPVQFDLDKATADVTIVNGSVTVKNLSSPIEHIDFAAHFAHRVATIQKLTATFGGGAIQGGGDYKLAAVAAPQTETAPPTKKPHAQLNVFVKATNIRTGLDPYVEAAVRKADLVIATRRNGKLDVSGEIDLERANITYEIDLPTLLKKLQGPRAGVAGSEVYEKREPSVYFSVVARGDRNIVFENNLARLEFRVDLLLTGNNVETGLIGSVDVVKGHAMVWNNDYKVTNASVQFIDETQIKPAFDINAQTDVRDVKVFVNVAGTLDSYQVTLTSEPPFPEPDIVALLTVGVPVSEFQTAAGGQAAGDQAMAVAAQQLLGSQFRTYTGLNLSVDNSRGTPNFKASKEVYKNVTASLLRSVSDPTVGAEIEWDFARYWAAYGEWSNFAGQKNAPPSGGYGPGVGLSIDFR